MRPGAAALLVAGWAALLTAWALANPPFASPDEWSHYVRAVGVGRGDPVGDRLEPSRTPPGTVAGSRVAEWVSQGEREVELPPGLWAEGLACNGGRPDVSAACLDRVAPTPAAVDVVTPVGNYQPLPYVLPGVAALRGNDPESADRLGRLAAAATCLALFGFAAAVLVRPGDRATLLGLLAAVTPMVVFVCASLNPSGLEIAAALAFAAGLLRIARREPVGGPIWAGTTVAGAALALSRSPGPLWVVLIALVAVGLEPAVFTGRDARRFALPAAGAVAAAVALSVAWEAAEGSHVPLRAEALGDGLHGGIARLPGVLNELVGVFGSLDSVLPEVVPRAWQELVVALVVLAAVATGCRRERLLLAATAAGALALPVAFSAVLRTGTGFDVQGRHVLPFAVVLPLLAAELLVRGRARLPFDPGRLAPWAAAFAGAVQLLAWYWNARRQAVGADGPLRFLGAADWSPPLGWWPWLAVAAVGSLLVAVAPFGGVRPIRR